MKNEIEYWYSEYELRQFIDMSERWPIKGIYSNISENQPYSVYTFYVNNARTNFEKFCTQLQNKLSNIKNWKAIEIDLNDRFLSMINQYIRWYDKNKDELKIFGNNCPYSMMLNVIVSTKKEILKYFPALDSDMSKVHNNMKFRYSLFSLLDKIKEDFHYKSFSDNIKANGYFGLTVRNKEKTIKAKIYTPELAYILLKEEYELEDLNNKVNATVQGQNFRDDFIKGFINGEKHFEKDHKVSTEILYGNNARSYVEDLHVKYCHNGTDSFRGWNYVKTSYPLILTRDEIQKFGYYSGLVSVVDELVKNHPKIFEKFGKCEHKESQLDEVALNFEDLFYNPDNSEPCLSVLKTIEVINSRNEYIFKNKGIIPLWIKLLKSNDPAIIKPLSDKVYVKILNTKIKNLKLTSDASEFRKYYSRIEDSDYELQIKSLISQLSQNGKLGK